MEKAYKVLARNLNISHKKAKKMCDDKCVFLNNKILRASELIAPNSKPSVNLIKKPNVIFQNDEILAINKPEAFESYELEKIFRGWNLLHRLDKHTSGVILMIKKDSEFHARAIEEFKNRRVKKEYLALVSGIVAESEIINKPILTFKGKSARSKIDKNGAEAITKIEPLKIIGKKTLIKVSIETGRTHQIRVHLSSIARPVVGEFLYAKIPFKRLMLHAHKISILNYEFCAPKGSFWKYLQEK